MFLAPAFLIGLVAIGLPLWLHRFARRTDERRPFASLMLLEASEVHRSRKYTLRYLSLLALRLALLIAIALAFAEPVLRSTAPPFVGRGATLHVIVLDTSLSMQYGGRWEQALARARRLIGGLDGSDRAMLVAAGPGIRVVHEPVRGGEREELLAALGSIRPTMARLDYGMLMTSAQSWIGSSHEPTQLHLITDLQQSASPLRFADLSPPAGVQLRLVDIAGREAVNAAVVDAGISQRDPNALEVSIAGAAGGRDLVLSIDGREQARKAAGRGHADREHVTFSGLELGAGSHRVALSLRPRDGLPHDDDLYLTLDRTAPRVLLVSAGTSGDDAAYLAAAVGSLTDPRLEVDRSTADRVGERLLAEYAALIISDAGILSDRAAGAIGRYLEAGGTALLTLGPRAAALSSIPLSGHETVAGALLARSSADRPGRVSEVDESHPALREAQGWRSIRFFRHVPLVPRSGDAVLIRFEQGAPLLIESPVRAGRLLIFTSPLDRQWNDLAVHPLFVRFVGEAMRYLTNAGTGGSTATVGSVVSASLKGSSGAQIFDPRGRRVLTLGDTTGTPRWVPDQPGFYEVRGGGRAQWIAVNVDPRESDLARMPAASIGRWARLRTPAEPDARASVEAGSAPEMRQVWLWLLMVAAVLAFVEPLVANYHLHVRREVTS